MPGNTAIRRGMPPLAIIALLGLCIQANAQPPCPELTRLRSEAQEALKQSRTVPASERCYRYVERVRAVSPRGSKGSRQCLRGPPSSPVSSRRYSTLRQSAVGRYCKPLLSQSMGGQRRERALRAVPTRTECSTRGHGARAFARCAFAHPTTGPGPKSLRRSEIPLGRYRHLVVKQMLVVFGAGFFPHR
jgi:hypothetical protein